MKILFYILPDVVTVTWAFIWVACLFVVLKIDGSVKWQLKKIWVEIIMGLIFKNNTIN